MKSPGAPVSALSPVNVATAAGAAVSMMSRLPVVATGAATPSVTA